MKSLLFSRTIVFILATVLFFSCISPSKYARKFDANPAVVPADFNPAKHILLVAEMPRLNNPEQTNPVVTRKMEKALKEYCPYKYEIVPLKDIYDASKYADTSVYKYAILNSLSSSWHTTTTTTTITRNSGTSRTSVSPSARTTTIDYGFFDRVSKKRYNNSGSGTSHINYTIAAFMDIIKKTRG